jgi:hypothetical protein
MPTLPVEARNNDDVPTAVLVVEKYATCPVLPLSELPPPPPPPTQVPLTAKHPFERLMPLAALEVAEVPVRLR